jgi:transposase
MHVYRESIQIPIPASDLDLSVKIVYLDDDQQGFEVQPRRWVVERTFAWLMNYRRLSRDYEERMETSDSVIYAAMTHLMGRRLARLRAKK